MIAEAILLSFYSLAADEALTNIIVTTVKSITVLPCRAVSSDCCRASLACSAWSFA